MVLSMELMNEAAIRIDEKLIKKYNDLLAEDKDYDSFIKGVKYELLEKINKNNKPEFDIDKLLNTYIQNRRKTKKRWFSSEDPSSSELQANILDHAIKLYKKDKEAFYHLYKVNTVEDFKVDILKLQDKKNEKISEWLKNDDCYLLDFEYIYNKKSWQISQASQSDVSYVILNYLKRNLNSDDDAFKMPFVMSDIPVELGGKRKVSLNVVECVKTLENNKEEVYYRDIEKYNNTAISTYVSVEYAQKYCLANAFKHFNAIDNKIFLFILSRRKAVFFETHQIIVDISDIVKYVYETDGAKSYQTVKDSIEKIANIKMEFKDRFISRIFTEVIYNEAGTTATIYVGEAVVKQIMEQQTLYIYGDKVESISAEAFSLICALQGRRMKLYGENKYTDEDILPYSFFQLKFRLSDKRKKRNLPVMYKLLQELKKKKIIIKEVEQISDDFHVVYYPLTAKEITKFVASEEDLYLLPPEE